MAWSSYDCASMADDGKTDYYELLQVSMNAEPDTIHRVYRLLAQRFHPDNGETGNSDRFHQISEAYAVLSSPESRARYDVSYHQRRQDRWRLVSTGANSENDFEMEQNGRLTLLEALYTRRRMEPMSPTLLSTDLESLMGRPREHIEFTIWYLTQKKLVSKDDQSRLQITADGVEYLEENYRGNLQRRRLQASNEP
jgi:curved DNA-binding protein CbpA